MRALLIAAALMAAPAAAEPLPEWSHVGGDMNDTEWYIRTKDWLAGYSGSRSAKMWITLDSSRDRTVPYRSAKLLYTVDCVSELYRYEQGTYYYSSGDVRTAGKIHTPRHSTPGTILAAAIDMLCEDVQTENRT